MTRRRTDRWFDLRGKVAVIVGGAGHIGSTLARALDDAGSRVFVLDLPEEPQARRQGRFPKSVTYRICDTTSKAQLERCRDEILKRHRRVDLLLNAAGANAPTPFLEIEREETDRILGVNFIGTLLACQAFGEVMVRQRFGSIINFTSVSAGPPLSKAFVYSAAKAAVLNLTQNLAREWARANVRVNALKPGFLPTEWSMKHFIDADRKQKILAHTPMGRFAKPHELVSAVLWLASDSAGFVTGSIVTVDGGFTAMTL